MNILTSDISFFICTIAVLLYCVFYYYNGKSPQRARSRVFEILMFNMLFASISALVCEILDFFHSPEENFFNYMQEFFLTSYFVFHSLLAPFFALYVVLVNNWGELKSLKGMILFISPALFLEIFVLTNPLTGFVFYYQDNVIFTRGPMELLIYAEAVGYLAFTVRQILIYKAVLIKSNFVALCFFIACSCFGVAVQFFCPWFKLELFAEALSLLGVLLLIEKEDAHTDVMTGVYNRQMFIADNKRHIQSGRKYVVMVITLANFKMFLRMVNGESLNDAVREIVFWVMRNIQGTVYRIEQDRIAVITTASRLECDNFAANFRAMMQSRNFFEDKSLVLSTSIDIVSVPSEIDSVELLVELGDEDRGSVNSGFLLHREEHIEKVKRRVEIEKILQKAIQNKSFEVYYQPIWNAETGMFDCAEALVRLFDANNGSISPREFIPIAEQNGMIGEIGGIVFSKVCEFLRAAEPKKFGLKYVDVNLSVFQLYLENTDILFKNVMSKNGISTDQIHLEICDSEMFSEDAVVQAHYQKLRELGFVFSLDNFAMGYANLIQVIQKQYQHLKLSESLLQNAEQPEMKQLLFEVTNLVRKFRFDVVQKGVETQKQLEMVLEAGANKIQGFYYSKPLEAHAFVEFIRNQNATTNPVHI